MVKQKNICFVTTHFAYPRQRALEYYEKILPKDVNLFLFCQKQDSEKYKTKRTTKITYSCSKLVAPFNLRRFCMKNNIDVIINLSGISDMALSLAFAGLFNKTKSIFYFKGNVGLNIHLKDISFLFLQFFIDRFLTCSKDIEKKTKKYLVFSRNKIFYLPHSINTKLFKPKSQKKTRKKLKLNNKKTILYVGRISYLKGSDFLYKTIKSNPDKTFILIGKILDKRFEKPMKNVIHYKTKNARELVDFYNAADLFLFLSRTEGFARAAHEAMSCGLPVIVSNIECLRLFKPTIKTNHNIKEINKHINYFFNLNQQQKQTMSRKSRQFVLNKSSIDNKKLKEKHLRYFLDF